MAAVFGGTQSLHTNALDEAIALPSEFSARIARNTQLIIQEETDICHTVDPFGGSFFMERLTHDLVARAKELMKEVQDSGGMVQAINKGIPKLRIEESAAKKQARIDSGADVIIGVNKYQAHQSQGDLQVRDVDNTSVRESQIKRLEEVRKSRDEKSVRRALDQLRELAQSGTGNLLEQSVIAAKARATLGEISETLAEVFGRHKATIQTISAVYSSAFGGQDVIEKIRKRTALFAQKSGRRPRILVCKLGQDGHDRGAKVIATGLADLGFDVDIGPMFQTPEEAAKEAIENDVHVVGISSQAAGHKTLVPELIGALRKNGGERIKVVVGGIIPTQDYEFLTAAGCSAIFGPGTPIPQCAESILDFLEKGLK
jgi:methylmalonyl-CoA mutase